MNKLRSGLIISGIILLIFYSFLSGAEELRPKHAPNTLPGVEPEMLTPEYWIALQDDADEVIMTPEEIEQFNEKVRNKRVVFRDHYGKPDPLENWFFRWLELGLVMNPIVPLDLPNTLSGDSLKVRLKTNIEKLFSPDDLWGSKDFYDGRNAIYNYSMKQEIVDAMNVDDISNVITRRFGIIVNHTSARYYPTLVPGYHNTKTELDRFQAGGLCIGIPVAILHESVDGDFLYVENPFSRAWVATRDIAIADRETIRALTEDKNFLLAAAHKVPVYGDSSFRNFARYFYFSATIPLIKHDRNGYVVKMPYRKTDGAIGFAKGYVKPDADVHVGYFPYTKRNVINQIFKLLNQPYGWEDQDNKLDCCGTMLVLLRCFGITTGRFCNYILSASDHQFYMNPNLSTEEKIAEATKLEPVITMAGSSGHIVLYLGKANNGKLYFIHQAGWGYDEDGQHFIVNRVTVNSVEHKWYDINSPKVFTTIRK